MDSLHYSVICNSAFRSPTVEVSYQFVEPAGASKETRRSGLTTEMSFLFPFMNRQQLSFSPFPADMRISPVSQDFNQSWVQTPRDHASVVTLEPLGHLQVDFDVDLGRATIYRNDNNEKIRP